MSKDKHSFILVPENNQQINQNGLKLYDGSNVAVLGGGPAGSFFTYFLLDIAKRFGINLKVDIYESKYFSTCGPKGCNHCGGIVSESLVQILATEGINLPEKVVQRGIDSYVLHTDTGSVKINTPLREKRIAAMFRGSGPKGMEAGNWSSFDGYLLDLAIDKGANLICDRVTDVNLDQNYPRIITKKGSSKTYDLVVGALGVNTTTLKIFEKLNFGYKPPSTTKTYICEFPLGSEVVQKQFGNSMHVFLLDIPRLKFAALIPKGNFVSLVILGKAIDKEFVETFLQTPEVLQCFPQGMDLSQIATCQCFPAINIKGSVKPFADRVILIGDSAVSRLYKDGIGAAYITAKAAATTAILEGISEEDFRKNYQPVYRRIIFDNTIGKFVFLVTQLIQKLIFTKRGILTLVAREQRKISRPWYMSQVLWDTFTGSAQYRNIFLRTVHPLFIASFAWESLIGIFYLKKI